MKSQHFLFKKTTFSHPNIAPAKKSSAKIILVKYLKNQALNRLKKSSFHVVPFQKQKNAFSIRTKNYSGVKNLFGGESKPGLQSDKLGYSPLCYTGQFRA